MDLEQMKSVILEKLERGEINRLGNDIVESLLDPKEYQLFIISSLDGGVRNAGFDEWYENGYGRFSIDIALWLSEHSDVTVIRDVFEIFKRAASALAERGRCVYRDDDLKIEADALDNEIDTCTSQYLGLCDKFMEHARLIFEQ